MKENNKNEKMTSGEIAKKAGVSQKAIRLYDEKGLLKPSEYSDGNYRLYDKEALLVLEKIIALKQIGYSLEEIKDHILNDNSEDILASLNNQIELMEAKRYELEKSVTRIKAVLARTDGEPDWDDVSDILKSMQVDQNKDSGHFFALDHTKDDIDWYVKLYRYVEVKKGERVLDLGCGFSKIWRNNWKDIPENVKVDAYDIPGSWADDFDKFIESNKNDLAKNTEIDLKFENLEDEATWQGIEKNEKYSMILAHYMIDDIKDKESFIAHAAAVLDDNGYFSLNAYGNVPMTHFDFWYEVFNEVGIKTNVIDAVVKEEQKVHDECVNILSKYFEKIEERIVPCTFKFSGIDDVENIFVDLEKLLRDKKFVEDNKAKLQEYFEKKLASEDVKIPHDGGFWRLSH